MPLVEGCVKCTGDTQLLLQLRLNEAQGDFSLSRFKVVAGFKQLKLRRDAHIGFTQQTLGDIYFLKSHRSNNLAFFLLSVFICISS